MGATLRATRALVLLAGFYLLGFVLLGALGVLDWAAAQAGAGSLHVKVWIVSVLLAIPIVQGMFALRAPREEEPDGIPVDERQEPQLWALVRSMAEQTGTRAPDEIHLVAEVNAAVSEEARLLGLRPGKRRLVIGLPLMTGLNGAQLSAVLAHEFGHYGNHDTRLAAISRRGWTQVVRTVVALEERAAKKSGKERQKQEKKEAKRVAKGKEAREVDTRFAGVTYRLAAKPFKAYGHLYMRAMRGDMRRQEYAADLAAARIAGRDATASALREIPVLSSAYGFYMDSYATLGAGAGLLPPRGEVFGGLRHLLAARGDELNELRRSVPDDEPHPFDTHPPIADRVARIERLPYDGRALSEAAPALHVLADPGRALAELEQAALTPEARQLQRAEGWPQLVHSSMAAYVAESAEGFLRAVQEVQGGDGSLGSVLDAADAGRLWQVADRLPKSEEAAAATGRAAREFARPVLRSGLSALVTTEMVHRGWAHFELSWSDSARLRMPDGYEQWLKSALDAAVADIPDTTPLRQLLSPAH